MLIIDDLEGWVDVALCEPADESTPMRRAEDYPWCTCSARELDELFANPPPGGWPSADDARRLAVTTAYPWLFGLVTPKVEGAGCGALGSWWSPDLINPTFMKGGRCDRGRARGRKAAPIRSSDQAATPKGHTPHPAPSTLGVTNPPPAYLPAGLLEALPPFRFDMCRAATIDIVDRLAANESSKYRPMNNLDGRKRYGRVRLPELAAFGVAGRPHVWDVVIHLLQLLGIVEHRENPDGTPRYRPGRMVGGKKVGGSSMSYRLTDRWRGVLAQERVERDASLWVPPPGVKTSRKAARSPAPDDAADEPSRQTCEEPDHYRHCRTLVRYDLDAAIPFLLKRYGAELPATVEFKSLAEAIEKADVPEAILARCKPPRPAKRPVVLGDRVTVKGLQKLGIGKIIRFRGDGAVVQFERGETREVRDDRVRLVPDRTAVDVARGKAVHRLKFLWRWQVDGREWAHRDSAGHRLHNAVTALSKDLRQFLRYEGVDEELVQVDACNSQMAILATLAARSTGMKGDIIDVVECCATGLFYERTFELVHGHSLADIEDKEERDRLRDRHKRTVMSCYIYASREDMPTTKLGQALSKAWPRFTSWLLREKTNTSVLPCRAQQIEAGIWIDRLAPALAARDIPAQPVHDSVIVPRSRANEVVDVLQRLHDVVGIRIKLRVEPLAA